MPASKVNREVVPGSTCADHTDTGLHPSDYLGFFNWCARMEKTHVQRRCAECGLWKIWLPKEVTS